MGISGAVKQQGAHRTAGAERPGGRSGVAKDNAKKAQMSEVEFETEGVDANRPLIRGLQVFMGLRKLQL
jgi:hypothetical protein